MAERIPYESFFRLDTGMHTQAILQIRSSADGKTLVTAAETTLRVWDLETRKPLRTLLGQVTDPAALIEGSGNIKRFVLSPDGRWVVVLRSRIAPGPDPMRAQLFTQLQVLELATGDLRAGFDYPGLLFDLDFSEDGRYFALASQPRSDGLSSGSIEIHAARSILGAGFKRRPPTPLASLTVNSADCESLPPAALRFLPQHAGSQDHRLIWATRHPDVDPRQGGQLGWFAFSSTGQRLQELSRVETGIVVNPATLAIGPHHAVIAAYINLGNPEEDRHFLCHDHQGRLVDKIRTEARPASLVFTRTGTQLLAGMAAENEPGVAIVRTTVFDTTSSGSFIARSTYYGHDDSVAAAAFLPDGTAVTSGGDNYALHFWSPAHSEGQALHVIRGVGREVHRVGINAADQIGFDTLPDRYLPREVTGAQRIFDLTTMSLRARAASDPEGFDLFTPKWQILPGSQTISLRSRQDGAEATSAISFSGGYQEEVQAWTPDLTLFVGADDEWVIWTRSGYYNASPHGARHFGFHVNRGSKREALYIPSDRFKLFYRPDIVQAVVAHGSEAAAIAQGAEIPAVDVAAMLPPVVEMAKDGVQQSPDQVSFSFTARSPRPGRPVTRVWILQNDRFAWTASEIKPSYAVKLSLQPGRNHFAIMAETADSKAIPLVHVATGSEIAAPAAATAPGNREADSVAGPGRLYLLCVGVSNFEVAGTGEARGFKPLAYAHRDAIAIRNALAKASYADELDKRSRGRNRAFESVEATVLLDRDATKAAIISEVNRLSERIRHRAQAQGAPRDVLFVFLSGHGVRAKGKPDLYFWNHDLRPADLAGTGLSLIELGRIITSVPAEVVLAIDACHSGSAGADVMRGLDPQELAERIHAVNERGMYILNASRSEELAHEHADNRHGFFTQAILDTLRLDNSFLSEQLGAKGRKISMLGLTAAVQELVPYYTDRKQSSVCRVYGDLLPLVIFEN